MNFLLLQSWGTRSSVSTLTPLLFIIRRLLLSKKWRQLLFLLILSLFTVYTTIAQECRVSTLAGSGTRGFMDGLGGIAQFSLPSGIALDGQGNIYVGGYNYRVRKIDASGLVTTLAGTGTYGYVDGPGDIAQFGDIRGIAVDKEGNVYVTGINRVRKIDTSGMVTTLAGGGDGTGGFMDGLGDIARFSAPTGIAVDGQGNLYVADSNNQRIRKIDTTGMVTTLAGGGGIIPFMDGPVGIARFRLPRGVVVDTQGNVYVADTGNNRIRKIDTSGMVTTLAGNGTAGFMDGVGSTAQFFNPTDVVVDEQGNVYVADVNNQRIRKIDTSGLVTTLVGNGMQGFMDGAGDIAQFFNPDGITLDKEGNIYLADRFNNRIRKIACTSCSINAISIASPSACMPNGDNPIYTADVTVTFADVPATGNLVLSGDGSATVEVGNLGNETSHTFTAVNLLAHGGAVQLTATFDEETTCSYTETNAGTAPEACNFSADQCNRAEIVEDYNTNFIGSTISAAELGWTGNVADCTAGTVSSTSINKNLQRINYFRRLCGLSDNITFDNTKNQKCQEAALIMDANNRLSHFPPSNWTCFSENGNEGALRSNLGWMYGADLNPISYQYIHDFGASNTAVGHRRWILYSRSEEMGVGFTDKNHALWVTGNRGVAQFTEFIAYPPKGFVPAPLVYPRWSFGLPNANFNETTVSMSFGNNTIPLTVVHKSGGAGDPTIVWEPEGIITDSQFDLTYTVNISNVNVFGTIQDFSYEVTIINPVHPPVCPDDLQWSDNACACTANSITLRNTIPDGIYQAKEIKVIDGVVLSGASVELRAENTICILPNTHIQSGASFSATIIPMNNTIIERTIPASVQSISEVVAGLPPNEPPSLSAIGRSSLSPQNDIFSLEVAPNPIMNQATISYSLLASKKVEISIHHISGKVIHQQTIHKDKGTHSFVWDATPVPTGLYYVSLRQGVHQQVVKVIISR